MPLDQIAVLWTDIESHLDTQLTGARAELTRSILAEVKRRHETVAVRGRELSEGIDVMSELFEQAKGTIEVELAEIARHRGQVDVNKLADEQILAVGERAWRVVEDTPFEQARATAEAFLPLFLLVHLHHDVLAGYLGRPSKLREVLEAIPVALQAVLEDVASKFVPVATIKALVEAVVPQFERERKRLDTMTEELDKLAWLDDDLKALSELSVVVAATVRGCAERMDEVERDFQANARRVSDIYQAAAK
jgi:hypothetical protein